MTKKILIKNNSIRDKILERTNNILSKIFTEENKIRQFCSNMQALIYSSNLESEKIIDKFVSINCLHIFIKNQFETLPEEYSLIFENDLNNFILKILKIKKWDKNIVNSKTLDEYNEYKKVFKDSLPYSMKENNQLVSAISSYVANTYGISLKKIKFRILLQILFNFHDDEIIKLMKACEIKSKITK